MDNVKKDIFCWISTKAKGNPQEQKKNENQ